MKHLVRFVFAATVLAAVLLAAGYALPLLIAAVYVVLAVMVRRSSSDVPVRRERPNP